MTSRKAAGSPSRSKGDNVLYQNNWIAAQTYLAISGPFIALNVIFTVLAAVTPPGVPAIVWLYVLLSVIYLPVVAWAWRQESTRASQAL